MSRFYFGRILQLLTTPTSVVTEYLKIKNIELVPKEI